MAERFNSRLSFLLNRLEQSPNNPRPNVEGKDIYETAENILNVLERDSEFINEARYVRLILSKCQSVGRESLALAILQIYEYYKTNRNLAINTIKDICKNLEKETGVKNIEIPQSQQQSNLPNPMQQLSQIPSMPTSNFAEVPQSQQQSNSPNPMQQSSQITSIPTSHNNFDFDRIKFELNIILFNKAQFLAFLYLQCTNYLAEINTLNKETDIPTIKNHIFTLELYRFWEYFLNHFSASLSQIDQNTFTKTCHEYWIVNSNEDSFYITRLTNILSSNFSQFVQTFDYIASLHTNGNSNSEYTISSLIPDLKNRIVDINSRGKNLYAGIGCTWGNAPGDRNCFFHSALAHISFKEYLTIKNYVDVHDFTCPWSNKKFLETVKENIRKDIVNYEPVCYLRAYIVMSIYTTHQNNLSDDNILELQTILGMNVIDPQTKLPTNSFVGYFPLPALAISQILDRNFLIMAQDMRTNNTPHAQGYIYTYKDENGNWTYSIFSTDTMLPTDDVSAHTKFIKEVMEGYEKFKYILLAFIDNNHFVPFTPLGGKVLTDVGKFSNINPSKSQPSTQQSAQLKPTPMVINQSQNQQSPISQQISPTSSTILQNQQQLTITPKTKELTNIMQIFTFQAHIIPAPKLLTEVLKALNKELGIRYNYINCLLEMFEDANLRKDVLLAVTNLYEISQKNPFYTFKTILSLYDIWHSNPYFELPKKFNDITNDHEELFKSETFKSPSFIILFEIVQDKQKNHVDITKAQEEFKNNENQLLLLKEKLKVLENNVGSSVKYLSNLYCMFPDLGKIAIEQLYEIYFSFGDHNYVIEEIDNFRNILEMRETVEESILTALIFEFSKEINEKFETYKNRQNPNSNTLTMTQNNNQFKETETIYEKIKTIGKITGQNVEFLYEFFKKYPYLKFSIEKLYLICTEHGNSDYTKDKISELSRIYEKFANNNKPKATEIWITRILPKDLDKTLLQYNKQFSSQQPQQNPFSKVTSNSFDSQSSSEPSQNNQQNFERQLTMNEMLEVLRKDPNIGNNVMCLNELSKNGFKAVPYVTKLFEIYKEDKKYVSDVIRNTFSVIEDWKSGKLSNDEKKADKTLFDILRNIFNDISNTHKKIFENPNQFKKPSNMPQQRSSNISNQKPPLQPKFASATGRATQYNKQFSTQQPQQNSFPQFTPNPSDLLQSNHQQQNFEMQPSVDEMLQTIETMTGQSTQNFREMFKIIPFSKNLIVAMYEICLKYPNYISTKIAILNNAEIFDEESVFEIIYDILQKYEIYKNTQQMPSMFADVRIRSNQYNNQQTQQNPIPQNECVIQ